VQILIHIINCLLLVNKTDQQPTDHLSQPSKVGLNVHLPVHSQEVFPI